MIEKLFGTARHTTKPPAAADAGVSTLNIFLFRSNGSSVGPVIIEERAFAKLAFIQIEAKCCKPGGTVVGSIESA
jgi:hypothetical protein